LHFQDLPILADLKAGLLIGYRAAVVPCKVVKLQIFSNANFLSAVNEAPRHEVEVHRRTFLTSALDGGVLLFSPLLLLRPGQRVSEPTCWMDSGASLDVFEKGKISWPCLVKPVA